MLFIYIYSPPPPPGEKKLRACLIAQFFLATYSLFAVLASPSPLASGPLFALSLSFFISLSRKMDREREAGYAFLSLTPAPNSHSHAPLSSFFRKFFSGLFFFLFPLSTISRDSGLWGGGYILSNTRREFNRVSLSEVERGF